jgi:hypothetical protein
LTGLRLESGGVRETGSGPVVKSGSGTPHRLGQAPFAPIDLSDLCGISTDAALLNEREPYAP